MEEYIVDMKKLKEVYPEYGGIIELVRECESRAYDNGYYDAMIEIRNVLENLLILSPAVGADNMMRDAKHYVENRLLEKK